MIELTVREYDQLPTIYNEEDNVNDIKKLSVDDLYVMRTSEEYIEKGSIISAFQVVEKRTDLRVESKVVMVKII